MEKDAKEEAKKDVLRKEREKKMPEYRRMWLEEVIPNWQKKYVYLYIYLQTRIENI